MISIVPRFTTAPVAPSTTIAPAPLISSKFSAVLLALSIAPSIWIFPASVVPPVVIFVELPPARRMLPVSKVMVSALVINSTALLFVIWIVPAPDFAS